LIVGRHVRGLRCARVGDVQDDIRGGLNFNTGQFEMPQVALSRMAIAGLEYHISNMCSWARSTCRLSKQYVEQAVHRPQAYSV
jgi:hypothetical protein